MKKTMKTLRTIAGLTISLICLALLLRGVHFAEVVAALSGANYLWLLPAAILYAASIWGKVIRWGVLFHPREGIRRSNLFAAMMVGYLGNTILPARLGEVARAYFIGKTEGLSKSLVLSTVVVEKVLDVCILLLFLAVLLPFVALPAWIQRSSLLLALTVLALFAAILTAAYRKDSMLRWVESILSRLPGLNPGPHTPPADNRLSGISHKLYAIRHQLDSALSAFTVLRHGRAHAILWIWSLVIWILSALFAYVIMLAFHITAPFAAALVLVSVTSLGMTVPSSPGYVGVYHYLVVTSLALFGVSRELALSYAFVLHLLAFLPLSLLGVFYLWKESLSVGQLTAQTAVHPSASVEP